jgi:phosphate transport system ATP-binding protein
MSEQPTHQTAAGNSGASPPDTCIRIRDFSFHYGQLQALGELSLDIPRQRVTAFIGPSGCGKSTLLRSINRMNDLIEGARHTGEIQVNGIDVYDPSVEVISLRKRIGMVFQASNPFPMSIYENVVYSLRVSGVRRKGDLDAVAEESLRRAALWEEVKDRLHENALSLSGGQMQRLCIARAIANQPEVILMDEPCSALDPVATGKIEDLIYRLKNHYTIVIVTHNMQQAARVSDRTAFFYLGRLVEYDATENLFFRPRKPQTEAYITGRFG